MSSQKQKKIYQAAIYIRLSREDGDKTESDSVVNQRVLIEAFLQSKPDIQVCSFRVDDGYSGVNFNRPAFKAMLEDIKSGDIDCVIVKDLSRFGRNYIEAGRYIEQIFPFMGVRFIAVNDGYDSARGQSQADGLIIPFKNLINDAYSRDISIKIRSALAARCRQGEYIGAFPLYGYRRCGGDGRQLEVDDFAAMTVRDIFRWKIQGMSNQSIARRLNVMGMLSPLEYKRMLGWAYSTPFKLQPVAAWHAAAVARILKNEIYTGTLVQGKEGSPSYKIKKKFCKPPREWIVVPDTHQAIVSREDFDLVRRLSSAGARTPPGGEGLHLFSGLLQCGACNRNMIRRPVKAGGRTYVYYMCGARKARKEKCGGAGRISEPRLADCVLTLIQKQISMACQQEQITGFLDNAPSKQAELSKIDLRVRQKHGEYDRCQRLISGLYEDYKEEIISRENYFDWEKNYEQAASQILEAVNNLEKERRDLLKNHGVYSGEAEEFKRNKNITALGRAVLVSLIQEIIVFDKRTIQIRFAYQSPCEISPARAKEPEKASLPADARSGTLALPQGPIPAREGV